jgi:hypothetical protein
MPLVARHNHVHRIPPHVRDDAYAPLAEAGRRYDNHKIPKNESEIFFAKELDLSGKSVPCRHDGYALDQYSSATLPVRPQDRSPLAHSGHQMAGEILRFSRK